MSARVGDPGRTVSRGRRLASGRGAEPPTPPTSADGIRGERDTADGLAGHVGPPSPGGAPEPGAPGAVPPAGPPPGGLVSVGTGPRGRRQRMRETLLREPGALSDQEVLEMLLALGIPRMDTGPLAKAGLNRFGGLRGVLLAPVDDLVGLFGRASVPVLKLVVHAADRLARAEARERPVLRDWGHLDAYLASAPAPGGAGRARVLFLNSRNQLLADEVLAATVEYPATHPASLPREATRRALDLHASALILVLGRAGKPGAPTQAELALAVRLKQASGVLSIVLHDVLLAGDGAWTSLRRKGML